LKINWNPQRKIVSDFTSTLKRRSRTDRFHRFNRNNSTELDISQSLFSVNSGLQAFKNIFNSYKKQGRFFEARHAAEGIVKQI